MIYQWMGSGIGMPMAFGSLGNLVLLVGVIFLVVWAVKHLTADQLKRAGLWCVLAGIMLLLLSTVVSVRLGGKGVRGGPRGWYQQDSAVPDLR